MQNARKRPKSQLLLISDCFSKSDANFMHIANANMYINLALAPRVGNWVIWALKTKVGGRNNPKPCDDGEFVEKLSLCEGSRRYLTPAHSCATAH